MQYKIKLPAGNAFIHVREEKVKSLHCPSSTSVSTADSLEPSTGPTGLCTFLEQFELCTTTKTESRPTSKQVVG